MFADSGGANPLDVLSYYLRKRYAALLDSDNTTPGWVGTTQPNNTDANIGSYTNTWRTMQYVTATDDNVPNSPPEPDTNISTSTGSPTPTSTPLYQNTVNNHPGTIDTAGINAVGLLYWTSPDLKIGPTVEVDLMDTLATHCLTAMASGDEVGSYRIATSDPGGGTWSNKGTVFTDTISDGAGSSATQATYQLYLKTANTTEPSTPDNYIRCDATNNEIQLESSTDASTNKLTNDVYLQIIYRNHPLYNVSVSGSFSGTDKGTIYDKQYPSTTTTLILGGGTYTRKYIPSGTLVNATGPWKFGITTNRTP